MKVFWIVSFLVFAVAFFVKGEPVLSLLFTMLAKLENMEQKLDKLVKP